MECISYVLSFRMVFYYLVTTGSIFDSGFCENSTKIKNKIKSPINRSDSFESFDEITHKPNNKPIVMGTQKSVLGQKLKTFCVSISVFLPLRPKNRSCARKISVLVTNCPDPQKFTKFPGVWKPSQGDTTHPNSPLSSYKICS